MNMSLRDDADKTPHTHTHTLTPNFQTLDRSMWQASLSDRSCYQEPLLVLPSGYELLYKNKA